MKRIIQIILAGTVASLGVILLKGTGLEQLVALKLNMSSNYIYHMINHNIDFLVFGLIFAIVFFTIAPKWAVKLTKKIEESIVKYTMEEILMYIIGLAIGLTISNLIEGLLKAYTKSDTISIVLLTILYMSLGYAGIYIIHVKKQEIKGWYRQKTHTEVGIAPKVLDTSVLIDGRIVDIVRVGFIEGKLIVPSFVLEELRWIADSPDKIKREKGRRGLDLLQQLQQIENATVEVVDTQEEQEVDVALIRFAKNIGAYVITNDFNLNKVAKVQQVVVLNINELANAVKPILLPHEHIKVTLVKQGKEREQAIAYLGDGTMIVVEGGKQYIGEEKVIEVTKVLQTSAGRMIFGKIV